MKPCPPCDPADGPATRKGSIWRRDVFDDFHWTFGYGLLVVFLVLAPVSFPALFPYAFLKGEWQSGGH